jgi:hypothetical protein
MEELEKKAILEPDSEKKIQLYQNEIFRLKIYLNEYPERLNFESESEYHDRTDDVHEFIHKCESHIQIIKERIDRRVNAGSPNDSLQTYLNKINSYAPFS